MFVQDGVRLYDPNAPFCSGVFAKFQKSATVLPYANFLEGEGSVVRQDFLTEWDHTRPFNNCLKKTDGDPSAGRSMLGRQ